MNGHKDIVRIISILAAILFFNAGRTHALDHDSLANEIRRAMTKSVTFMQSMAINGGYAGIYSLTDSTERYGEAFYEDMESGEIWNQPPGTPSVGEVYLRAWYAANETAFRDAARDVGRSLAWGQRLAGGWGHLEDVSGLTPSGSIPERPSGKCTFDDDISQGSLRFLMNLDLVLDEPWLDNAVEKGIGYFMNSQFENGAWPQWYPLIGGYHDYYTYNDATINDCIAMMIKIHERYGEQKYLDRISLAGDFIILSQIASPQAGWAQQYNHDMEPAWARSFEPPGVCSAVTSRVIRTLVDMALYTQDDRYLTPIPNAIAWLDTSAIDENLWARLYEIGTNVPIYGDRDNQVHYTLEEISKERRIGYSWQSSYGIKSAKNYYNDVTAAGLATYRDAQNQPPTQSELESRLSSMASKAQDVMDELDSQGRWVNADGWLYTGDFVKNFGRLADYLETYNSLKAVSTVRNNRLSSLTRLHKPAKQVVRYDLCGRRLGKMNREIKAAGIYLVKAPGSVRANIRIKYNRNLQDFFNTLPRIK
jgi:hypothetical protein